MCRCLTAIVVFLLLLLSTYAGVQDARYKVECKFTNPLQEKFSRDGHVALFSLKSIHFDGKVVVTEQIFCNVSTTEILPAPGASKTQNHGLLLKRGACAFSTKAKMAETAGFQLLIIANSEEEGFPVGPPELDFALGIPVVMVGQNVWADLKDSNAENGFYTVALDFGELCLICTQSISQ